MAPKKSKKISLNEFLGDSALGSWADEMDTLPNAPAAKIEEAPSRNGDNRFSRRDDFRSERPGFSREEVPLPTQAPYTAFVGNLAFDLTDTDIANHFNDLKINSVKIIKDKDERPKGFGYVEFEGLDGLKEALSRSGSSLSGRTIRVSVAEPPKDRPGFAAGHDDEAKFDSPWRRDGPLPDLPKENRRRFDTATSERTAGLTEDVGDWRAQRPLRASDADTTSFKRKGSSYISTEGAEKDDSWTIGGKFKASAGMQDEPSGKFSSLRHKGDFGASKEAPADEGDWRGGSRISKSLSRNSGSPTNSTPPTPQLSRRKLELLPRSGNVSTSPSPMASPKLSSDPHPNVSSRPNPFGAAKPVDVSHREKEVEERLEKDRDIHRERFPVSRTNSRSASERTTTNRVSTPPPPQKGSASSPKPVPISLAATVRPSFSFANAAAKRGSKGEGELGHSADVSVLKSAESDA